MTDGALSRLLRPRSIAVIGGGAWCGSVVEQCLKMGFDGAVWPVHPSKPSIGGVAAFADLDALPHAPDAVFIGVNRYATVRVVDKLRSMGAGGAICFASGFLEADAEIGDGATLQQDLIDAAGDMPIIGPNCYGLINYLDGALLWPDQHGGTRVSSGVAILTQSSNMALNITMQTRGLPLAYVVTAGNQAQTGVAKIGSALLSDERVTALGLHIEGIGDLRAFEDLAATAQRLGKPIVALKAGKSDLAQAAALSHTASLTGSDAGARALLHRLRIAQVDSLPALLEALKLLHFAGPLASNRIVSMSCSGGEASLIADTAEAHNVCFPPLSEAQKARLRITLAPMVPLANPLDYHTFIWSDVESMADVFCTMLDGEAAMGCLIVDFPRADRCEMTAWDCVLEAGAKVVAAQHKPFALLATLPEALPEVIADRAIAAGMIPLHGLDDALSAIEAAALVRGAQWTAAPVLLPGKPHGIETIYETEAKADLARFGLTVPRAQTAHAAADLKAVLGDLPAPFVLKIHGEAHKTESGGVRLFHEKPRDIVDIALAMGGESWLIEEMIVGAIAELLIGVTRDPAHGFVLTLGAGGTLTELWRDTVSALLPVTENDILDMLTRLRIAPLLQGYRGAPAADMKAIVAAVLAVQAYVVRYRDLLDEVEINPLIVTPDRAVAVDALIRKGEKE